ncbi:MAG: Unknown protein [uncultured Sulfurovum sp.]|uniref:Uncharacterized protein n=1 Tax=uncultured Sulfurovum sp. TaxID=269237 RepID=A0A6S6SRR5_9BACT|nr:MAG: Unknown protein [uncultured Sulfurovum sp.]
MSEKDEVLQQISEIKSHLVDKEAFFPYNYSACHVWSIIAVVLSLSMVSAYEYSILFGSVMMFVLISIGFMVEGSLTKKVNESYDIDDCTKRQRFIMMTFLMMSLFLILMSSVFASYKLYSLGLISWLFIISLGYFSIGFVLNIQRFSKMAQFNMIAALVLLAIGVYFELLLGYDSLYYTMVQATVIFGLAVVPTSIAYHQRKQENETKVGCGV